MNNRLPKRPRILILGIHGMLGHDFSVYFQKAGYPIYGTQRRDHRHQRALEKNKIYTWDANSPEDLLLIIRRCRPQVVINCIGITTCLPDQAEECFKINAWLPIRISEICSRQRIRFIHISSDAVFDGKRGRYTTQDNPSPIGLYALSKSLAEGMDYGVIIRTSIIGESTDPNHGLLNWVRNEKKSILKGFSGYIWSGVTTLALAKMIEKIIVDSRVPGRKILHVSSKPISKAKLLSAIQRVYNLEKTIHSVRGVQCNRSLIPSPGLAVRQTIRQQLLEYRKFSEQLISEV